MKATKKIIAIIGLSGSGKTEVIEYLMKKYGWPKVYFGEITFDEVKRRGLEINEKNERFVREDLRKKYGQLYYAEKVVEKIKKLRGEKVVLVESLYMWEEYMVFREKFGKDFMTVAIYASPEIRYQRLKDRPIRPLTRKEARGRDYAQIENLHQAGPIAMADITVDNTGTKKALFARIDKIIKSI